MIKRHCFIILLLLSGVFAYAGDPGFQFLRVGLSARAAGMGDAMTAQTGDVTTFLYNPAGLAHINGRVASASYLNHWMDIRSGLAAYAQPVPALKGVVGGGLVYFDYGKLDGYDVFGNPAGTYSAGDFGLNVFYARTINERTDVGATLRWVRSEIDVYKSSGLALDLGVIHDLPANRTKLGLSLLNIGWATSSFAGKKESMPFSLQVGASQSFDHDIVVNAGFSDLTASRNPISRWIVGTEWSPVTNLTLRTGMNHQRRAELHAGSDKFLESAAGFSAGFSFRFDIYTIDYSFASWGIGALNRFSINIRL